MLKSAKSKSVICLMGPTAAGKTDIAVELAQHIPCDIISVDSAMVYRGMDIGTAKPTAEILAIAPHQLIDIRDPSEPYSAADFCQDALPAIQLSLSKGRIPLLVGGTMLYFRALQQGLAALPSADMVLRQQIAEQALQMGWPALHAKLNELDPVSAERIHQNDAQRIQRALEVITLTNKPLTHLYASQGQVAHDYDFINIGLAPVERARLHQRIAERFSKMLKQGLIEEVEVLKRRADLNPDLPALRSVGYRQVWDYLSQLINFEEMQERGIIATRQLAKRQLTWLRHWQDIIWQDAETVEVRNILAILSNKAML